MRKVIIGISGASGVSYGIRLLEVLGDYAQTHLIITESAKKVIEIETNMSIDKIEQLAYKCYSNEDCSAAIASGSFLIDSMAILPCSIKTLSAIALSMSDCLIVRAADVIRKERRQLILGVREMPFHSGHLKTMCRLSSDGVIICPPIPSFYAQWRSVEDIINSVIAKYLDIMRIEHDIAGRWNGPI